MRRRERYTILYIFKILKGLVPNLSEIDHKITFQYNPRRGLLCQVPPLNRSAMAKFKSLKEESLPVRGCKLFNCIPAELRNLELSFHTFKHGLDGFLQRVPDQPAMQNYPQAGRSNSLLVQLDVLRRRGTYL